MNEEHLVFERLEIPSAEAVYNKYMIKDFPKDELKPFFAIKKAMEKGTYIAYGAYGNEKLAGYAFFATAGKDGQTIALLDYFAVIPELRGQGIGTEILKALSPDRLSYSCILIESESIDGTSDKREQEIRRRRIRFYENCGAVNTGVTTHLYGVNYDILALCGREDIDEERAYELTEFIYNKMYHGLPWFPGRMASVYRSREKMHCDGGMPGLNQPME